MILQAKGLTKNYGDHTAVKDINLVKLKRSLMSILGLMGWQIDHDFNVNRT